MSTKVFLVKNGDLLIGRPLAIIEGQTPVDSMEGYSVVLTDSKTVGWILWNKNEQTIFVDNSLVELHCECLGDL